MPRRRVIIQRPVVPDPVYGDDILARFVNRVMVDGKKSLAERMVYGAFKIIQVKTRKNPLALFHRAIDNVKPSVEVKSRRVGGSTYQVPIEVRPARGLALAMRWIVNYAQKRGEKGFMAQLAAELMDAADEESGGRGKGGAVKKREDTHRMADANKAFSHYRW
jgi:small subunit ribosomal protein S7